MNEKNKSEQKRYSKDEVLQVTITDIGNDGEGIGKVDGYTLFIKDAVIGDTVEAKIMKPKKNYAYAHLEQVLEASPDRIKPRCPIARQCGGCQLQSMSYERQLQYKADKVKNNLIRLGGFAESEIEQIMEPILAMEKPFRYRNKAQFPIGTGKDGKAICGFYAGHSHDIIPVKDCYIGTEDNKQVLQTVLDYMDRNHVPAYSELTGNGKIRHVLIRKGFTSKELMVCLVITQKQGEKDTFLPAADTLINALRRIPGMTSISVSINNDDTNVIMGDEIHVLWGSNTIQDSLCGLRFHISPLSFYQVNPVQAERLYNKAIEYAALTGAETVWDLYCGIGTITLAMARKAGQVYGVESIPQAIEDARENATINGISNADFYVGKAEEVLPQKYAEEGIRADVIVVDPPRKGCDEQCLATMLKMQPQRIVYVSCDSATLARDLRILCDGGYKLEKVCPADMFAWTVHVETVCLLSKLHEAKHHVSVKLDMDELDLTASESKATYEEIKKYVAEHYDGMKVTNLYIAQVMRKCGIELAENFNLPKWEGAKGLGDLCSERTGVGTKTAKQPQCPKEKEDAIVEALKHFKMI